MPGRLLGQQRPDRLAWRIGRVVVLIRLRRTGEVSPPDVLTAFEACLSGLLDTDADLLLDARRVDRIVCALGDGRRRDHTGDQGPHDVPGRRQTRAVRLLT